MKAFEAEFNPMEKVVEVKEEPKEKQVTADDKPVPSDGVVSPETKTEMADLNVSRDIIEEKGADQPSNSYSDNNLAEQSQKTDFKTVSVANQKKNSINPAEMSMMNITNSTEQHQLVERNIHSKGGVAIDTKNSSSSLRGHQSINEEQEQVEIAN